MATKSVQILSIGLLVSILILTYLSTEVQAGLGDLFSRKSQFCTDGFVKEADGSISAFGPRFTPDVTCRMACKSKKFGYTMGAYEYKRILSKTLKCCCETKKET